MLCVVGEYTDDRGEIRRYLNELVGVVLQGIGGQPGRVLPGPEEVVQRLLLVDKCPHRRDGIVKRIQ